MSLVLIVEITDLPVVPCIFEIMQEHIGDFVVGRQFEGDFKVIQVLISS